MMINFGKIPCLIMADSKMWRGLKPNKAKKVFELYSVATREFGKVRQRQLLACLQLAVYKAQRSFK